MVWYAVQQQLLLYKSYKCLPKKKLDKIWARLEHTVEITEIPYTRNQDLNIVSSLTDKAS
jgi:hypothetical protein